MATVTPGYSFTNDEVVTPAKLNSAATPVVSNIVTADIVDANVTTAKIANGAVTQEKLNSSVTLVPTGAIMPFAMNTVPTGWLAANGSEYSKTGTYERLFAVIGTTYGQTNGAGGTGTTHFRVPDLRGYFVRGSGTNSDAVAAGTFGAKQADSVRAHTHSGTSDGMDRNTSHSHTIKGTGLGVGGTGSNPVFSSGHTGDNGTSIYGTNTDHLHTFTTSSQSPAGTTETRPANIALLYCIKI
jgi:microcystin-dependent protein